MNTKFNFTVFEHRINGNRTITPYCPNNEVSELITLKHCVTSEEAEEICNETKERNILQYLRSLYGDSYIF